MTWIESESGNLINSDRVGEFGIVGPYFIEGMKLFDLYAFGVGLWEHAPAYRTDRYLIQHADYEDCKKVLARVREGIADGLNLVSAKWEREQLRFARRLEKQGIRIGANGSPKKEAAAL